MPQTAHGDPKSSGLLMGTLGGLSTDTLEDPPVHVPSFLFCLYILKGRRRTRINIKTS